MIFYKYIKYPFIKNVTRNYRLQHQTSNIKLEKNFNKNNMDMDMDYNSVDNHIRKLLVNIVVHC